MGLGGLLNAMWLNPPPPDTSTKMVIPHLGGMHEFMHQQPDTMMRNQGGFQNLRVGVRLRGVHITYECHILNRIAI